MSMMLSMDSKKSSILSSARSGFTLIELLVVIAVVGVLAGAVIAIINPNAQFARARDAKRRNDIRVIKQALEEYLIVNGSYPVSEWTCSSAGGSWIPGLNSSYLKKMPVDPKDTGCSGTIPRDSASCYSYCYYSAAWCGLNGRDYLLHTRLEAYTGTDLSQQPYYSSNGAFCSNWSEGPASGILNVSSK